MCRILMIIGRRSLKSKVREKLLDSFIKSVEYDPYLDRIGREPFHADGWGKVLIDIGDKVLSIYEYRTIIPLFEDKENVKRLLDGIKGNYFVELIHARKRSKDMPKNLVSVQPIGTFTDFGTRLYLAHNGTIDKNSLVNMFNSKPSSKLIEKCSDSCLLTLYLSKQINVIPGTKLLNEVEDITLSALNVVLLHIKEKNVEVLVKSFYKKYEEYYKLYIGTLSEGLVVSSSTLTDFYKPDIPIKWEPLENRKYFKLTIDRSGIYHS